MRNSDHIINVQQLFDTRDGSKQQEVKSEDQEREKIPGGLDLEMFKHMLLGPLEEVTEATEDLMIFGHFIYLI